MRARTGAGVSNLNEVAANHLLPTPTVAIATGGNARRGGDRGDELLLPGIVTNLLPTPAVVDLGNNKTPEEWDQWTEAMQQRHGNGNGHGASLHVEAARVAELFPTPRYTDGPKGAAGSSSGAERREAEGRATLPEAIQLLPTPLASEAKGTGPADANRDTVQLRAISHLLPTPTTQEDHSGPSQAERNTRPLNDRVLDFLPTPLESEGIKPSNVMGSAARLATGQVFLTNVIVDVRESSTQTVNWGKYAPAIARTEAVIGVPAPAPTMPDGKNGKHRLSSLFVEWMMLLAPGTVTGRGLTRAQELGRLGNGVVPLQAAVAITGCLADLAAMRRAEL